MAPCPGTFTADTKEEVLKHVELHAREAHQEDPAKWSAEDREGVRNLIR
jgi:predicted small metal-binding protein